MDGMVGTPRAFTETVMSAALPSKTAATTAAGGPEVHRGLEHDVVERRRLHPLPAQDARVQYLLPV